ncbi:MAG: transcription initiation factor IIB family protein [Candidatus Helarchaeota archaeon]|nr:transcription initiation factor IIB family protein [Candidatus Helarchaeota archaeon]
MEAYPCYEPQGVLGGAQLESKEEDPYYDCCGNPSIIEYRGIYVCQKCATVFGPVIVDSPRRAFTQEEIQKKRIREPVYTNIGPRTVMNVKDDSVKNKVLYYRLAKINKSVSTTFERNLTVAQPKLLRLVSQLGIPPSILNVALGIYKKAVAKHLTTGRSINNLVAASIFIACRKRGLPRTIEEISEVANIPLKVLAKNYRLILRELHLHVKPLKAKYFVERFVTELGLTMDIQKRAQELLVLVEQSAAIIGKDPKGIAAAAIYVAIRDLGRKEHRSQTKISEIAHISEVTLRNRVRNIKCVMAGS